MNRKEKKRLRRLTLRRPRIRSVWQITHFLAVDYSQIELRIMAHMSMHNGSVIYVGPATQRFAGNEPEFQFLSR